ncbi:MAG: beta-ketoacyl-ACP synthase II [Spirochaetales bacterium]|nr:beta-ketoacyl-ACP synthase II [Spirochaetales bacterium]
MARRVVITGLGTVNPLGNNVKDFWKNVVNVENGIDKLTKFDTEAYPSKVAGIIRDFNPLDRLGKTDVRRNDLFSLYALYAALEAHENAGIKEDTVDPTRMGVIIGNGIGGLETLENEIVKTTQRGGMAVQPLLVPKMISNIAPGAIAIRFNAQGPCFSIVTACASGTDAMGEAMRLIQLNMADMVFTGGTEAPLTPIALGGFCVLQALSTGRNDQPDKASRPFDKGRDGFVIAEGAGILVFEELEHAKKRGARIYAEVAGYGISCDANHITAPHPEGRGGAQAIKMAVESAGLKPEDIDYINAHGTSTPINDPVETKAIKLVFGDHAKKLKVSSTKSMTGHLLGGAGGIEAIVTALAIQEQYFPATRNYEEPDPECDLDYVPNKGYNGTIRAALSNSLGFGGHNGILCLKKYAN